MTGESIWRMTREEWEATAQAQMAREQDRYRDLCRIAADFNADPRPGDVTYVPSEQFEAMRSLQYGMPPNDEIVGKHDPTGRPPIDYSAITRDFA